MFANLKFRSKRGMSLAVSLTICLFLIMVTGGITTVAILQQNETGSNMNSRQAYISAKSGLDTFQDALKNGVVTDLPISDGDEKYYVFYYDLADSNKLKYYTRDSEEDARALAKMIAADDTKSIVGGEGTYFKIKNKDGKFKVTALNVTGKYNANVSMNRGDLSFDAVIMTKYTFGLKTPTGPSVPTGPSTPSTPSGPTDPSSPTDPTLPTGPTAGNEPVPSTGGRFMMVGQQTCFNETTEPGGGVSTGNLLSRYYKNHNGFIVYSPSVENAVYGYSYFPVVYDRFVKCETTANRTSVSAINEGIYLLGAGSGWTDVDEYYAGWDGDTSRTFGTVSYITQNESFQMDFNCKFLCIKNNFVSIGQDSRINYCGSEGTGYVVAYLPNNVTFYHVNRDKSLVRQPFTKPQGYYLIKSGSLMCNPSTWDSRISDSDASLNYWKDFNQYDTIMNYYTPVDGISGEIHSGCHEDGIITNNIRIVDDKGRFNTYQSTETGFTKDQSTFTHSNGRNNQSIFLAPNTGLTETGYYNWYCGRSFNFQWFRTYDFTVNTDCHINMSASNIVLTIGPLVTDELGNKINVSNWVVGKKGASWKLYGNNGTGCPGILSVMCGFNVKYYDDAGREQIYTITAGTYTNVTREGLNIFSDEGKNYFLNEAIAYSLTDSSVIVKSPVAATSAASGRSGSVTAGSISVQTSRIASLFSRFTNEFSLSPMVTTIADTADHTHTLYGTVDNVVKVNEGITNLYYTDNDTDGDASVHTLVASAETTIQKGVSSSTYEDYIVFKAGTYKIPAEGTETTVDIYSPADLIRKAGLPGSNYELKNEEPGRVIIIKEYY